MAPGFTVVVLALPSFPAESNLKVPALTANGRMKPVLAALSVVVPLPILVMLLTAPIAVVVTAMLPAPEKVRAWAPLMPPLRVSVSAVEPIVAAPPRVIAPLRAFVPLKFSSAPPLLMPEPVRLNNSAVLTPLICTAEPTALETTVLPAVVPSAPAFETFNAPAATVATPVHVELLALISKTPLSFLRRALPAACRLNGVVRVSVLPCVTSRPLLAAFRRKVRSVENVPVARKPLARSFVLIRTIFPVAPVTPSAASVDAAR